MKFKLFVVLLSAAALFTACDADRCNQTVTYTKATAIYMDMAELRNAELNLPAKEIEDAGKIYVADDFLLIGEEGEGIHVIDNSDESNPTIINFINVPMNREYIVDGNTIYAESQYDMMAIDISDLSNAKLLSREESYLEVQHTNDKGEQLVGFDYQEVTESLPCTSEINPDIINFLAWNNELIPPSTVPSSFTGSSTGQSGTINRLAKANDHLYMITNNNLHIFDATSGISKVSTETNFDDGMETIIIRDNEAFIGKFDGMAIVDISNPTNPRITNTYNHEEACDPVLPHGEVAYVTLRVDGPCQGRRNLLDVVDLSRSSRTGRLSAITRIDMLSPFGMTIDGNILYVGEGKNGLKEFDITNPASPQLISWNQNVSAYDIILHPTKDLVLLAGPDGLSQYEDGAELTVVSNITY